MRIAIVASPFCPIPPAKYGGTEAMIDCLARALHRAGHDVELIALEGSTCPVPTRQVRPPEQSYFSFSSVCHELSYALEAYSHLDGFDVVHDHTMMGPAYARAFPDIPVVVTNHGPFEGVLNAIYAREAPWIASLVGISASQAATAPVPVSVVHHGIDSDLFTYGEGEGDEHGSYLLFLGRMQPIKGVHLAAQAAIAAGARLVIAAKMQEVPEREYFEREVEPLLGDAVEFVGEVGGARKLALLQGARALLNPLQWDEPFGLTMTEALACGTPVIALRRGSVPEIVDHGETGFVLDEVADFPSAIDAIHTLDRKACRIAVETYFNMDRMASDYVDVYADAVAHHRSSGR